GVVLRPHDPLGGGEVADELRVAPAGDGVLYQVRRADRLLAQRAQQLDRAGIDARDVGDRVTRRVFDRDAGGAVEQRGEAGLALLPGAVDTLLARQLVQGVLLQRADQDARFASCRHEVVPAAGDDLRSQPQRL